MPPEKPHTPKATVWENTDYTGSFAVSFNGEKNMGEMGPVIKYVIQHAQLSQRSWQLYLESEVCHMVFRRYANWVIGTGLKLQAEPQKDILKDEGITINPETFNKRIESRWKVFSNSKVSDYANLQSLNSIAKEAFINSKVCGDVLVVLRIVKDKVQVQLIDGMHLSTPANTTFNGKDYMYGKNRVRNGVEIDATGQHIAYHVRDGYLNTKRIEARDKSGLLRAYLVYGLEYRIDTVRGIPLVTAVMESAKKMERYKEATIGSAEERQKIAYQVVHNQHSDGENPVLPQIARATGVGNGISTGEPITAQGERLARTVAATTNKQAYNMPIGSEMRILESKNELYFKDFFTVNINLVCATIGIPPEVALSKYDSNFSASRAALKDWEHTLLVERKDFADQFYQPIYNLWLHLQVLLNKISAPGYLSALSQNDWMVTEAYRFARFVGANVPHIDPLKEVAAERAKLGSSGAHIPLTTVEQATEALNGGDSMSNMLQYSDELKEATTLGIAAQEPAGNSDNSEDE